MSCFQFVQVIVLIIIAQLYQTCSDDDSNSSSNDKMGLTQADKDLIVKTWDILKLQAEHASISLFKK